MVPTKERVPRVEAAHPADPAAARPLRRLRQEGRHGRSEGEHLRRERVSVPSWDLQGDPSGW